MGLVVTHISLEDFRSYERLDLDLDPVLTVLVGPNATGKTNAIEAVQFLATGQSFRKPAWADVVRWGSSTARGRLKAQGEGRDLSTEVEVDDSGRRSIKVNGKTKRSAQDLVGLLPVVVFTPDDLRLVKDAAEKRRAAVDSVGDQLSKSYLRTRLDYDKTLRQRNALLKKNVVDSETMEAWSHALVTLGAPLSDMRKRLFTRISEAMSEVYGSIAPDEELSAAYVPSWEREGITGQDETSTQLMERALKAKRAAESARGSSLVGPHRDEIVFFIDGRDARAFASQGQQRTIALAWKLAEVRVVGQVCGQQPLLLLDDVMSELDETRRGALAQLVGQAAQTIMTTTNLGYFDQVPLKSALIVRLS